VKFVKVIIRCHCGEAIPGWCVRIERSVPANLRCSPAVRRGGEGPRAILCPRNHKCFDGPRDLERAVDALTRHGG
jgi:hypothetical protein